MVSRRTVLMIAALALVTIGVVALAIPALDGEVVVSGRHLTAAATPWRFWRHVAALAIVAPLLPFGWLIALSQVREDRALRRRPWRPTLEDERFRGSR